MASTASPTPSRPLSPAAIAVNKKIETEQILGPLPKHWEKVAYTEHKDRFYFVDHKNKTTSWIDPRTYHLRKHNIAEVAPGELPYGWEEIFDESLGGVYYADHLNQQYYQHPPWDPETQNKVWAFKDKVLASSAGQKKKDADDELERTTEIAIQKAESEIAELNKQNTAKKQERSSIDDLLKNRVSVEHGRPVRYSIYQQVFVKDFKNFIVHVVHS
jgi:hypothetical protein